MSKSTMGSAEPPRRKRGRPPKVKPADAVVATAKPAKAKAAKAPSEPAVVAASKTAKPVVEAPKPVATAKPIVETIKPVEAMTPVVESLAAVAKTIADLPRRAAPPSLKGISTMPSTMTPTITPEKVQAMFTEFNDRAKAAMEKSVKLGEEMTDLTKGNVEALVTSAKVAAKGMETLGQEAADFSKKSFDTASGAFRSMATVKSPTELLQLQSDFARNSFDQMVAEASKLSEAWVKLAGDVFQPISNRYAVTAEKFKSASL